MTSEYFTMVASLVTGLAALAGVWMADSLAGRRGRTTFNRQLSRENREQLEDLFARVLSILDRAANNWGKVGDEDSRQLADLHARLALRSTRELVDQFEKVIRALNEWAAEMSKGSPRPGPDGVLIYSSGFGETKHNERTEELWPVFFGERSRLLEMMRTSLDVSPGVAG